jgi:hypothetical protein
VNGLLKEHVRNHKFGLGGLGFSIFTADPVHHPELEHHKKRFAWECAR